MARKEGKEKKEGKEGKKEGGRAPHTCGPSNNKQRPNNKCASSRVGKEVEKEASPAVAD